MTLMMSWIVSDLESELQKININDADLEELISLEGIGKTVAERILDFRNKNGSFQKPEDLMLVKGVGRGLFEMNSDRIIIRDYLYS